MSVDRLRDRSVVLFDAGGTLITLDHDRVRRALPAGVAPPTDLAFEAAEAAARKWADVAIRAQCQGRELWDGYFSRLLLAAGVTEPALTDSIAALWIANREQGLWRKPIRGAREVLVRLTEQGYRLGVVSNAEGQVEADLADAGFAGLLETVVDSHLVGVAKPDPQIFAIALDRLGVPAAQAFYVGDVPAFDVDGANAADLPAVLVDPHGIHRDVAAAAVISNLTELLGLLALPSVERDVNE